MSEDETRSDWLPVEVLDHNNQPAELTDITSTPPHLDHSDVPHQTEILEGILDQSSTITPGDAAGFHHAPVKPLTVSRLRQEFEQGQRGLAMHHLSSRHRVAFEASDLVDHDDPALCWGTETHHLDFAMVVPRDTGCAAIMPNRVSDHTWVWEACFDQRHRLWTTKYGKLGFCHEGRMLLVGKAGGQNVWCAMAPNEFFHGEDFSTRYDDDPQGDESMMPLGRYRRLVLMWSYLFNMAQLKDIATRDPYHPEVDDATTTARWKATTSLL
jgi:hypothetical protein